MNEEMNTPKNSTIKTVLITVLSILLIGSVVFIAYDKLIKKEESNTEENNKQDNNIQNNGQEENEGSANSVDDDEIYKINNSISLDTEYVTRNNYMISNEEKTILKKLVFPFDYINGSGDDLRSTKFEEFNFDTMSRNEKMTLVASLIKLSEAKDLSADGDCTNTSDCYVNQNGDTYELYATETSMKNMYTKLYGTENGYSVGNIDYKTSKKFDVKDCPSLPYIYDSKTQRYFGSGRCGGESSDTYYNVVTKVTEENDKVYVYVAVAHVKYAEDYTSCKISPFNNEKEILLTSTNSDVDSDILSLAKENKLSNYKFTFKKQSDGKYYVYSGEWQ